MFLFCLNSKAIPCLSVLSVPCVAGQHAFLAQQRSAKSGRCRQGRHLVCRNIHRLQHGRPAQKKCATSLLVQRTPTLLLSSAARLPLGHPICAAATQSSAGASPARPDHSCLVRRCPARWPTLWLRAPPCTHSNGAYALNHAQLSDLICMASFLQSSLLQCKLNPARARSRALQNEQSNTHVSVTGKRVACACGHAVPAHSEHASTDMPQAAAHQ